MTKATRYTQSWPTPVKKQYENHQPFGGASETNIMCIRLKYKHVNIYILYHMWVKGATMQWRLAHHSCCLPLLYIFFGAVCNTATRQHLCTGWLNSRNGLPSPTGNLSFHANMCPCNLGLFKSFTILVPALPWQPIVDFLHRNTNTKTIHLNIHTLPKFPSNCFPTLPAFFSTQKNGEARPG